MREILKEINELQIGKWGCMPNLQGASPVGRDEGDRSCAARTVSKSGPD